MKKLTALLDYIYKSVLQNCWNLAQGETPIRLQYKSSEYVHKMTSFRIQVLHGSISKLYQKLLQESFDCLKGQYYEANSFELRSYDSPVHEEGFRTSEQARSVLLKSESLYKRVNFLAGRLSSNQISQDSCESLSARLNLHIPRTSLSNTPLSPLSMGELDTDRISNRINEEEEQIENFEILIKVWKELEKFA